MPKNYPSVSRILQQWFEANKRDLPWRGSRDPYLIWISEVILQQTRVAQGLPYFLRFKTRFPTVKNLAQASEQEVLKLWQGLGYYSRARNMHTAAKEVMIKHKGAFPPSFVELKKLKGIGDYTAAAIASLAFNLPHAAVDGNVYRVLSRLMNIDTPINTPAGVKTFKKLAEDILDKNNPGRHNEAIMEFGARVCTPQKPDCTNCPLQAHCLAFKNGTVSSLPVKLKTLKEKERYFHYLCLANESGLVLQKRLSGDIWEGLYQFPVLEKKTDKPAGEKEFGKVADMPWSFSGKVWEKRHQLTHQRLNISFYKAELKNFLPDSINLHIFVPYEKLHEYPMPKPIEIFTRSFLQK